MKAGKFLKLVVVTGAVLSLGITASVAAIAREDGQPIDTGSDMRVLQAQTTGNADETLMTTQAAETLEQRLTRRKEALTNRLTTAQTTRLRARCQAAQTKLGAISQRLTNATATRQTAYQTIQENLEALANRLETKVDTAELDAALVTLGEKISAYTAALETYQQTLTDLVELNCTEDAEGFKASLEAAKTEQAAVLTAAQAVRSHLQETVKPLLQAIRTELETN